MLAGERIGFSIDRSAFCPAKIASSTVSTGARLSADRLPHIVRIIQFGTIPIDVRLRQVRMAAIGRRARVFRTVMRNDAFSRRIVTILLNKILKIKIAEWFFMISDFQIFIRHDSGYPGAS